MSLTATILLQRPITLPVGVRTTHTMDRRAYEDGAVGRSAGHAKNTETKLANIERTFAAIKAGQVTVQQIADGALLAISTVKKALDALELAERIGHTKAKGKNQFIYYVK